MISLFKERSHMKYRGYHIKIAYSQEDGVCVGVLKVFMM